MATDLLFYDGGCGLCHRTVLFVLARDPDGSRFRFAPLGGETFQATFPPESRAALPDSIVIRTADGRTLVQGQAARHIGERVGGGWSALARAGGLLPGWLLDCGYDGIARIRKRLFARPAGVCPVVPTEMAGRFMA